MNASCSSVKEPEKQTRQGSEEAEENKPEEAMTVDTGHDTDTDSEQMEIDMGNEKDTSELGSKEPQERTKDSDVESVISADEKSSKKDNDEEKVAATDNNATESSSILKTTLKGKFHIKCYIITFCWNLIQIICSSQILNIRSL